MERPTKEIITKSGHKLVLKTYITGGEARELQRVFLGEMKLEVDTDGSAKTPSVSPDVALKAQDKAVELVVVSLDDSSENILSRILDLPKHETDEIMKLVDEVTNGLGNEKKEQ